MSDAPYTYVHHTHPHPVMNLCAAITFISATYMYSAIRSGTSLEWRARIAEIGREGILVEIQVRGLIDQPVSQKNLAHARGRVDALVSALRTVTIYEYRNEPQRILDAANTAWSWLAEQQAASAL